MKTLGYIVSPTKLKNKFDFIQVVDDYSLVDKNKPCLIIGLNKAKEIGGDNFSILKKDITSNLYWTFGRTEKREENEKDILNYYNNILNNNFKNINYYYINIFKINLKTIKKLLEISSSLEKKYIYIWNDMMYILYQEDKILGISLKMLLFAGYDISKIYRRLRKNKNNIISTDTKQIPYSLLNRIKNKQYIIPYVKYLMEN